MNITKTLEMDATERFNGSFNGEPYWVEAKTHAITPKFRQSIIEAANDPVAFAAAMASVLTSWNVYLKEEGDLPPTAENLATQVTEEFLWDVFNTISTAWTGDKKSDLLAQALGTGGDLGELPDEWYVHEAAKFLGCSFIELNDHPRKHYLMSTAFTLQAGIRLGSEIIKANEESKAKVNSK